MAGELRDMDTDTLAESLALTPHLDFPETEVVLLEVSLIWLEFHSYFYLKRLLVPMIYKG